MKKFNLTLLTTLLATSLTLFTGCTSSTVQGSNNNTQSPTTRLKVGASPVPHAEILEAAKPLLAAEGITLDIQIFTDYVLPNTSLDAGDLDANYFQHQPYLDSFNSNNGTEIVSIGTIHFEPLGIYPGQTQELSALQDGATIAIPNDTSNEARALQLLESLGFITLDPTAGLEATPTAIIANPYNLNFIELEAATIPRVLDDVDFAIVNGNYALDANIASTVLASEEASSTGAQAFANILATTPANTDAPHVLKLLEVLQSDTIRTFIETTYDGIVVPTF